MEDISQTYQLMIVGKTGYGKTSIVNSLVGYKHFAEGETLKSQTMEVCEYKGPLEKWDENKNNLYSIIDTPGLYCSEEKDNSHIVNIVKFLKSLKENGGINCIFFVLNLTDQRFDSSIQTSLNLIRSLLGDNVFKKLKIIYTFKNVMNEKFFKKSLERFKDLPELLRMSGFPIEGDLQSFIYDYDNPEEFCTEIIKCLKNTPKFYPEVLEHLENVDFDLKDPVKIYRNLIDNSKCIASLNYQLDNLNSLIQKYEKQTESYEKEKEYYRKQIDDKQKLLEKLNKDLLSSSEENKREINKIIEHNSKMVEQINQGHQKSFEQLRLANERENKRIADEQKSFLIEQERIRKEYQNKIQIDHQNSLRNMENQINQLNEKNKQLESRPPQIIYQGGGGGKRRCQIF